ncbi:UV excision repair protein [Butyriboletus roseoflavus]|nr:UV excision repair protein [Butyriboletus roseoflavus]
MATQVETQKLIYAGRILLDSKTVASCEIKEKDFLVLMVAKPKPNFATPATSSSTTSAAPATVPAPAQPAAPEVAPPSAPSPPIAPASAPASATQTTQPARGDFLTGDALQSTIQNMMDIGFEHEASRTRPESEPKFQSFGNRVFPRILFLSRNLHRLPAPAQPASPPVAAPAPAPAAAPVPVPGQRQNLFQLAQQQQQQQGGAGVGAGAGAGLGGPGLSALRDNAQMAQLRELVSQNPELLQPLIQQLAAANPQVGQLLAENPQALLNFLAEGGEEGEFEGEGLPGVQVVNITPEEQAAIERLQALGFSRDAAVEAYLVCDKNEERAANYLFDLDSETMGGE